MFRPFAHQPEVKMQTITKVVFTPKRKIYVSCKPVEYFIETNQNALSEMDFSKEFNFATEKLKLENEHYKYYGSPAATRIKVYEL
jgi:hypothetical protein